MATEADSRQITNFGSMAAVGPEADTPSFRSFEAFTAHEL
jgi:hypothetical protein